MNTSVLKTTVNIIDAQKKKWKKVEFKVET